MVSNPDRQTLMRDNIFGQVAPLVNPFNFLKGINKAAHDVFAPAPQVRPGFAPDYTNLSWKNPADVPLLSGPGPRGSGFDNLGDYVEWTQPGGRGAPGSSPDNPAPLSALPPVAQQNMMKLQQGLADSRINAGANGYEYPQNPEMAGMAPLHALGLGLMAPPAMSLDEPLSAAGAQGTLAPPPEQQWNDLFDQLGLRSQEQPVSAGQSLNDLFQHFGLTSPLKEMGGLSAPLGQSTPVQAQQFDPSRPSLGPGERPLISPMDWMRARYMQQFGGAGDLTSQNLNYMQQDLNRRSQRDRSDDFFGSVLAPTFGGMSKAKGDMAMLQGMGIGYMNEAQARRGERTNLVNTLVGRQNKAAEFLQATDPEAFANQMKFMKAQADANRVRFYGEDVSGKNADRQRKGDQEDRKITLQEQEAAVNKAVKEAQLRNFDSIIEDRALRGEEAIKNGISTRANIEAQIQRIKDLRDQFDKTQDFNYFKAAMDTANRGADRTTRENIAANAEAGATTRAKMGIDAAAQRQNRDLENKNQYNANRLDDKGKPIMAKPFVDLMKLEPGVRITVQHQWMRGQKLPAAQRAMLRDAIIRRYNFDPGA